MSKNDALEASIVGVLVRYQQDMDVFVGINEDEFPAVAKQIAVVVGNEVTKLRDLLGAAWATLAVGVDCTGVLADLQESGVYKPRCSDGEPSRADARKDFNEIVETMNRIYPVAFPRVTPPPAPAGEGEGS